MKIPVYRAALLPLACVLFTAACSNVPEQLRIRDGVHPSNIDKDVRFRTTYYFRTFDWCYGLDLIEGKAKAVIIPETDSLYRFRMTGKSNALFTRIHFESGTLQASQIDPFGAKVVYDDGITGFKFVSATDVAESARRRAARAEFEDLIKLYRKTFPNNSDSDPDFDSETSELKKKFGELLAQSLEDATGDSPAADDDTSSRLRFSISNADAASVEITSGDAAPRSLSAAEVNKALSKALEEKLEGKDAPLEAAFRNGALSPPRTAAITCESTPVRRGYQIMGPEGWRTFNQDERLIMAMSTSDQPLISVMQQYSDRILSNKADASVQNLQLARESLRIIRAERAFDGAQLSPLSSESLSSAAVDQAFEAALKQFEPEETDDE